MPKLHFISLFSADLDYDIALHWCRHYMMNGYDSHTVYLHTRDRDGTPYKLCRAAFNLCRFNLIDAPDEDYTTQMRCSILENFAKTLDPLDYMVVADSDEFHLPGPWASNFRDLIMSCDVLYGTLRDRWADSLHEANLDTPLAEQYPYAGDVFKILFDRSADPDKGRWRVPNPNKIIAARAGLPVVHAGSHALYHADKGLKQRRGCIVDHYKWRANIIDRLKTKWYYYEGHANAVRDYFQLEGVPA